MTPEWMLVALGALGTVCYLGSLFENWCIRREQRRHAPEPKPAGPWTVPGPAALETGEQASLAGLAVRYSHGEGKAGVKVADFLRIKHPGMTDVEIARMLIALHHVGRSFGKTQPDHRQLAAYLEAIGGAALHLTELERTDVQR